MNMLAQGFLESWRASPASPALNVGGVYYTYDEMAARAAVIAHEIRKRPGQDRIGVVNSDDVHTYAALLAITFCGLAYVPLNPSYPAARLNTMISEAGLSLAVGRDLPEGVSLDMIDPAAPGAFAAGLEMSAPRKEAYVLFTSGSTGTPKGVPVSFLNLAAFFSHIDRHFNISGNDRVLQGFDLSFDVSVFCIFSAWRNGACLVVPPAGGFKAMNILATLRDFSVTVVSMVPTVLALNEKYLEGFSLPAVRLTFFAGERLTARFAAQWKKVAPGGRIFNCYGPTEATIFSTSCEYLPGAIKGVVDVPIGRPFKGMEYMIVDRDLTPAEREGELLLAGDQVVEGYLNPRHNDRFAVLNGKRFYRTGDLVRLDEENNLHFLGRSDQQVKASGYRIELEEIEQVLLDCGFQQATVLPVGGGISMKLVAFVKGEVPDATERLARKLPAYMMPSELIHLPELPLGERGKVDRKILIEWYERGKSAV